MSFWSNLHPLLRRDKDSRGTANYAILSALNNSLVDAESNEKLNKIQLSLATATGAYLDYFGLYFGVDRRAGESDDVYRNRIKYYFLMPRATKDGITQGLKYWLNDPNLGVEVYEPYKDVFTWNVSTWNGPNSIASDYFSYLVIDVILSTPITPQILKIINMYKQAGVELYTTYNPALSENYSPAEVGPVDFNNYYEIANDFGSNEDGVSGAMALNKKKEANSVIDNSPFIWEESTWNGGDYISGKPSSTPGDYYQSLYLGNRNFLNNSFYTFSAKSSDSIWAAMSPEGSCGSIDPADFHMLKGQTITLSCTASWENADTSDTKLALIYEIVFNTSDGKKTYCDIEIMPTTVSGSQYSESTYTLPNEDIESISESQFFVKGDLQGTLSNAKIELGSTGTGWCPSRNDYLAMTNQGEFPGMDGSNTMFIRSGAFADDSFNTGNIFANADTLIVHYGIQDYVTDNLSRVSINDFITSGIYFGINCVSGQANVLVGKNTYTIPKGNNVIDIQPQDLYKDALGNYCVDIVFTGSNMVLDSLILGYRVKSYSPIGTCISSNIYGTVE